VIRPPHLLHRPLFVAALGVVVLTAGWLAGLAG
jgi:hypothetical protein